MKRDEDNGRMGLKSLSITAWLIIISIVMYLFILFGFDETLLSLKPSNILIGSHLWTLVTYIFTHVGIFHLLFSMVMLFSFAAIIERIVGKKMFLLFYLISGILTGILAIAFAKVFGDTRFGGLVGSLDVSILGAGGAVFAIAGLFMMLLPRLRFSIVFLPVFSLPAYVFVPIILIAFWVASIAAGFPIGNIPLLGGLIMGLLYGLYLRKKYRSKIQLLHTGFGRMGLEDLARFPSENPSPILRIARDGTVLYSNTSGKSLLKKWKTDVGLPVPGEWNTSVVEVLKNNTTKTMEIKEGDKIISFFLVPVVGSAYVNLYGTDITALKDAQAKLKMRNVELASLAGHEMKVPLTSITTLVELMTDGDLGKISEKQKENLDIVLHDARKLDTLIKNMVDASRIDEGLAVYKFGSVKILDLVEYSKKTSYVMLKEKNIKLEVEGGKGITVKADNARLEQVISNLITNAIKYGKKNGHIWISFVKKEGKVVMKFKDDGVGIAEEDIGKVFSKEFQVKKSAKRAIGSLGYGLYISKKILEAHKGEVRVESELGKGSTFFVSLPAK